MTEQLPTPDPPTAPPAKDDPSAGAPREPRDGPRRPRRRRPRKPRPEGYQLAASPDTVDEVDRTDTALTDTALTDPAHSGPRTRQPQLSSKRADTQHPKPQHPESQLPESLHPRISAADLGELRQRANALPEVDARSLGRRLAGIRGIKEPAKQAAALTQISAALEAAEAKVIRRLALRPKITYPPGLPVSERVDDLKKAISENQVIIVAGETGSGKSTQLPKICLDLGRGVTGLIGHTQPRRIAARALAERIAEETGTELGDAIGYTIRFGDHTGPSTLVKLMTDGILLAEIGRDRMLSRYDTIIIDEAHERSLNIDFLLGYLAELLPRRPDLRVIITSATIDPERFSNHFAGAPIVEVSGRTFPVEIRYRPYGADADDADADDVNEGGDEDDAGGLEASINAGPVPQKSAPSQQSRPREAERDQASAICEAVDELSLAGDGDILVFLSGEREIRDTAEVLRGHLATKPGVTEVLPLYGRLSAADQHKVFSGHRGRRVVLATNVAETSLTVPGIRYVIDPGTARISRYSLRTKVQRLPIENVSQASAGQRAGRCGRVADGICIRLYSETDFASRAEYTDPEITRTSLASVILRMASLDLGDITSFPFLDPPDSRQIGDGITLLTELGALQADSTAGRVHLTPVGRTLAELPLDPRLARMILAADSLGCANEVIVIAAALAIQDVREYPLEDREIATASHSRFRDKHSDFVSVFNLWTYLQEQGEALSGNAFRRMCRTEYLHYLRIREWQDLVGQIRQLAKSLKMDVTSTAKTQRTVKAQPEAILNAPSIRRGGRSGSKAKHVAAVQSSGQQQELIVGTLDTAKVHSALLTGLISQIGLRDEAKKDYQGTRGGRFTIWPGSGLSKGTPKLVMAAELVETSRLWARTVASIEPEWAETVGADLVKRNYSEPRWERNRGSAVATEKVTLLGVTLVAARTVQYGKIDPELSRELFIRHALVEGDWNTRHPFFERNNELMQLIAEREDRARRRDIAIDDETLYALYDSRVGVEAISSRHFDTWWRQASRTDPDLLTFTEDDLIAAGAKDVDARAFPDRIDSAGVTLDLSYVFEPGRVDDGVTVSVPLTVLQRVSPETFAAQVPGLRRDLAIALIRSLPKPLRRAFVPVPDFAAAALHEMTQQESKPADTASLPTALAATLTALTGVVVTPADFDLTKVPDHLRMTFQVLSADGSVLTSGKDLGALQLQLRGDTRSAVARASGGLELTGLTAFPQAGVPQFIDSEVDGHSVRGYPALLDEGKTVGLRVYSDQADQVRSMREGTIALLMAHLRSPLAYVRHVLPRDALLTLSASPHGAMPDLVVDATRAGVDALLDWAGGPAWTEKDFEALRKKIAPHLDTATLDITVAVAKALGMAHQAAADLQNVKGGLQAVSIIDAKTQLAALLPPGFITATTAARLPDLQRYLQALVVRLSRLVQDPERDRARMAEVLPWEEEYRVAVASLPPERRLDADVRQIWWQLAEWRVSLFAQPMKTAIPVSAKRIGAALAALG
ncbi:DUF3418 domain-containing protein [Nakamurella antarctica]|uniref:DUF3418 domain-containing protein n=1 Tax=Nakamurella antarctica TaxID=1902245 RepID=A0A3G8ZIP2_9ACTN|nr:DUF3418 domain-containing protein [Nakamurella antarctica]AZI57080.1 DUF3418 domain-containing protein [Nakamurella antarctica]